MEGQKVYNYFAYKTLLISVPEILSFNFQTSSLAKIVSTLTKDYFQSILFTLPLPPAFKSSGCWHFLSFLIIQVSHWANLDLWI